MKQHTFRVQFVILVMMQADYPGEWILKKEKKTGLDCCVQIPRDFLHLTGFPPYIFHEKPEVSPALVSSYRR